MTPPFPWLRKIAAHLRDYEQVPLFGRAARFDWSRFSALLASRLGVGELSIAPDKAGWRAQTELTEGLGEHIATFPLKIAPLQGSAFWMMPHSEVAKLSAWMLHGRSQTKPLTSEILAEGFYRYLLLQALDVAHSFPPLAGLSPLLSEESPLAATDAFCIDVEISLDGRSCWGRLAVEPQLQRSWNAHFASRADDLAQSPVAASLELSLGVKVGSALLSLVEWKKARPGDALLLDKGSYDPRDKKGAAYLCLGPTPLFQVRIKHNKLELLDYALMYEEEMTPKQPAEPPSEPHELPEARAESVAIQEVPIYVTVELARLKITLEKLTHLTPGNVIELPIQPEQPVHLTVNGQSIGTAELVHIGDMLGARILQLGK